MPELWIATCLEAILWPAPEPRTSSGTEQAAGAGRGRGESGVMEQLLDKVEWRYYDLARGVIWQ